MRELKFRAWDSEEKEMNYFCPYEDSRWNDGQSWNSDCIMQYTGLKDKNGKEIYEGDIVIDTTDPYETLTVVEYGYQNVDAFIGVGYNLFPFLAEKDYKEKYNHKDSALKQFEVIGNIYENPELIKENKNVI